MRPTVIVLATLGLMLSSSIALPPTGRDLLNYQGFITDSGQLPLGATGTPSAPVAAPINRKILFRLYDSSTGGNKIWAEEQTVTISKGEFSVLLGLGIDATYNSVSEAALHIPLTTVFGTGTAERYLGITVDDGNGTFNTGDAEITPRQRITTTAYSLRAATADSIASGVDLQFSNSTTNSGLGYYGSGAGRTFGSVNIEGPVLYGNSGGALGSNFNGSVQKTALRWDENGNIAIGTSTTAPGTKLVIEGNDSNAAPKQISIRGVDSNIDKRLLIGYNTTSNYSSLQSYSAASTTANLLLNPVSGTVAIGTTTPSGSYKLHVAGSGLFDSFVLANGGGFFSGNGYFTGALGIGETSPQYKLHIKSATNGDAGIMVESATAGNNPALFLKNTGSGGRNFRLSSYANSGSGKFSIRDESAGLERLSIESYGTILVNQDTSYNAMAVYQGTSGNALSVYSGSNSSSRYVIYASSGTSNSNFVYRADGSVGIGTSTPNKGKLEINGASGNSSLTSTFREYSAANVGVVGVLPNSTGVNSLYASGRLTGLDFIAFSDERIKLIDGRSDSAQDLTTLMGIEVTDYTYIDKVSKGSGHYKKVIAQQVEKVYPQAVTRGTDEVPDIFKNAKTKNGWVMLATNLKKGERVRLLDDKKDDIYEVLEVKKDSFRTEFVSEGNQLFVYGREVKDFRSVDYEAISMLNVSATQELAQKLEAKEARIASLEKRLAELEAKDKARDAKLVAIEKLLLSPEKSAAQTVSLKLDAGAE